MNADLLAVLLGTAVGFLGVLSGALMVVRTARSLNRDAAQLRLEAERLRLASNQAHALAKSLQMEILALHKLLADLRSVARLPPDTGRTP